MSILMLSLIAADTGTFQYQAPQAPTRATGWAAWGQVFYFLVVFGIVIGLTYLVTRALAKRSKVARQSTYFRVIDELPLGMGRSVVLLDCVDRILIIGAGERALSTLGQIDEPELVAQLRTSHHEDGRTPLDFGAILQRSLRPGRDQVDLVQSTLDDVERNAQSLRDLTQRLNKQRMD
jgi:flagellar biogenesis protein FliO